MGLEEAGWEAKVRKGASPSKSPNWKQWIPPLGLE